eukprot:296600-Alexandrium_andersonii.AAC.1
MGRRGTPWELQQNEGSGNQGVPLRRPTGGEDGRGEDAAHTAEARPGPGGRQESDQGLGDAGTTHRSEEG